MKRNQVARLLLILFFVGWAVYEMIPPTARDLLREFDRRAERGRRDATFSNIVARARELEKAMPGRAYASLKEAIGTNNISAYFPFIDAQGQKDPSQFILQRLQRESLGKIKLGLDLQGGTSFLVGMDTSKLATNADQTAALEHAIEVLRKRVDKFGVAEPIIQPAGANRITIQMPGLSEAVKADVRQVIEKAAFLEFRMVHPDSDELVQQGIVEPGYVLLKEERKGRDGRPETHAYLVSKKPERGMTGKYLKRAFVSRNQMTGEPEIDFELDDEGGRIFGEITTEFAPKGNRFYQLAIVLDGELASAPRINSPITGGRGVIQGNFDLREAYNLANVLENPLQAPVKIEEERSVDPSLGRDSIRSGLTATIIGAVSTFLFMLVLYYFGGLIANIALTLNVLLLMGVMCGLDATITLPGIAGIALTIGMAVDANVLIFERMREESRLGKSLRGVVNAGYSRAFWVIFDSNLTTLIGAVILIWMGTGPVQGFGYTLTFGIIISMFTALVVTRLIYDLLLDHNLLKSIRMMPILKLTKLPFMDWSKVLFVCSWALAVAGLGYGFYRGKAMLGVDFAGGDSMKLAFTQKVNVDQMRPVLSRLGVGDCQIQYQKNITDNREILQIVSAFDTGTKVKEALKKAFPQAGFEEKGIDKVGPTVGKEITRSAIIASLLALFGILVYVALRYELSFAVAGVIALVHDVVFTLGVYCLSGRQFGAPMVAAVLTIIGYSINDKIVNLDRIREDLKLGVRGTFKDLIDLALNQTLSRTIITGGAVILATIALLVFGGDVIGDFAFAFLVGTLVGTYSSIFVASPIVLWWHKGERPRGAAAIVIEQSQAGASA